MNYTIEDFICWTINRFNDSNKANQRKYKDALVVLNEFEKECNNDKSK